MFLKVGRRTEFAKSERLKLEKEIELQKRLNEALNRRVLALNTYIVDVLKAEVPPELAAAVTPMSILAEEVSAPAVQKQSNFGVLISVVFFSHALKICFKIWPK